MAYRLNEVDINLKLSINFNLYVIVLPLSSSFLICTEKADLAVLIKAEIL